MDTIIDITGYVEECVEYIRAMKEITELHDSINKAKFPFPRVNRFYNEWLKLVEKFIKNYGWDNVPDHLQSYIEVVKANEPIYTTECTKWNHELKTIKHHMKQCVEMPAIPQAQFFCNYWVPRVEAFVNKWGSEYVPDRILSTLADVKQFYSDQET